MGAQGQPKPAFFSKLVSEFVGTYVLIMAVGFNVSAGNQFGVTAVAFTLMISIYALGDVSGAHFNPAVSLALTLSKKLDLLHMFAYWCPQLLAGMVAASTFDILGIDGNEAALSNHASFMRPVLAEALFTCMLCFVVLNVAATEKNKPNQHYGLAIGLAIVGGGYASGPVSQGVLNPAVALGLAVPLVGGTPNYKAWIILSVGELLGAGIAAAIYRVLRPDEFKEPGTVSPPQEPGTVRSSQEPCTVSSLEEPGWVQKLIAEFVGTFYLVVTVALNVLDGHSLGAWSIAASLACMVYCLGSVSGAHLNPAVTLSLICRGSHWSHAAYIPAQLLGAIAGAVTGVKLIPGKELALRAGVGFSIKEAAGAEFIFTFVLAFVVLNIATVKGKKLGDVAGLAVGSCVTAGGFAVGRISGASLNPAVSTGLLAAGFMTKAESHCYMWYCIAEFLGGAVAAAAFKAVRLEEDQELLWVEADEEKQALLADEKDVDAF